MCFSCAKANGDNASENSTERRASDSLSRELADPIHFPRLAAVVGERLLHPRGRRRQIEPDVPNEDGPALPLLLVEELAALAGELAGDRREVDCPLSDMRLPV